VVYQRDGSLWAKGKRTNGVPVGGSEWFRKDGTKLRSGHFENGAQVGEWITYARAGQEHKMTNIDRTRRSLRDIAAAVRLMLAVDSVRWTSGG